MSATNPDTVLALIDAANTAMGEEAEVLGANGNELLSAIFTLTRMGIKAGIGLGADPVQLRKSVEELLKDCSSYTHH